MNAFLWEIGPARVYLFWIVVLLAQMAIAEINRRWTWTIFALWTAGGILMIPYVLYYALPINGWFPVGKYLLMVATATMTGALLVWGKRSPATAHRYAIWFGILLWIGLVSNIMEANIRDVTIFFQADTYYDCGASWQCLKEINATQGADMLRGLPEARGIGAAVGTDAWYQALAANFSARHIGIDPATGMRTIGGFWNLLSAAAGLLNCITVTGLAKVFVTSNKKQKVRGLIWIDQLWPWIIAYDLWNHAFLYNALADYTWYCTFALLLACTIPAFTWAKGQWIWFRCFTLMFWIAFYNWLPAISTPPGAMHNFATMNPWANIVSSALALVWNVGLFVYWLRQIILYRRNPLTGPLFMELGAFRKLAVAQCDDLDKYWLCDLTKKTPVELGFEPGSHTVPPRTWVTYLPWWGGKDRRYLKERSRVDTDVWVNTRVKK